MSCASIPKQAPDLSAALGREINVLEKSHLSLLHAYFNERRAKVDEFIETTWLPRAPTEEEMKAFFPTKSDREAVSELLKIVKSAEHRNTKITRIMENSEKFVGVMTELVEKIV